MRPGRSRTSLHSPGRSGPRGTPHGTWGLPSESDGTHLPPLPPPRQSHSPIPRVAWGAAALASESVAEATIVTVALLGAVGSMEALWAGQGADGALERWNMDSPSPWALDPLIPPPLNTLQGHRAHPLHTPPPPALRRRSPCRPPTSYHPTRWAAAGALGGLVDTPVVARLGSGAEASGAGETGHLTAAGQSSEVRASTSSTGLPFASKGCSPTPAPCFPGGQILTSELSVAASLRVPCPPPPVPPFPPPPPPPWDRRSQKAKVPRTRNGRDSQHHQKG